MLILNIETSANNCSVSLSRDGSSWIIREKRETSDHAALLTLFIDELIKTAGVRLQDLDAISVSAGPGSYTGLRIGVSVAKGLCYSLNKPLIATDTLKAMAFGVTLFDNPREDDLIVSLQDARRMDAYAAVFDYKLNELKSAFFLTLEKDSFKEYLNGNNRIFICGNAAIKFSEISDSLQIVSSSVTGPSSRYMEALSSISFSLSEFKDIAYFEPFYLKPPNVTKSKSLL